MKLYSAGQIVEKLNGVTTRQILDLAEKGLIKPARETTGQGSPRLYDFQNIFEICICLALRGNFARSGKTLSNIYLILSIIRKEMEIVQKSETEKEFDRHFGKGIRPTMGVDFYEPYLFPPSFDLLRIAYDDDDITVLPISFSRQSESLELILSKSKKNKPKHFCTYILEVSELWQYLMGHFVEIRVINKHLETPNVEY
mgnify:CR=1 FL=1